MKKNIILFCNVDREDGWVSGGIAFKVENTDTFEDAYNEIKHKLETPQMIDHLIEDRCLLDDLFEGDETYKFKKTYWNYGLYYEFENENEEIVEYIFQSEFICLI